MSSRPGRTLIQTALALLAVALITGCSRAPLTSPPEPSALQGADRDRSPAPAGLIGGTVDSTLSNPLPRPIAGSLLQWTVVTTTTVRAGADQTVNGGRYTLRFATGSLEQDEQITIQQYDPDVLDVQFGPHGTQFKTPVEVSIDFAGTAADPGLKRGHDVEPVLWYLDEKLNRWVIVPSVTDWEQKRLVVHLEHFSRYAVGGKAGWKNSPRTESDLQD